jgi:dissimilatory sulfite reductase (desulfoviridin) alpha/beta subunit
MRCVVVCKEGAISIDNDSNAPIIDYEKCLGCGHCLNVCPTKTLDEEITGYRVLVGGKLGRHPQFGMELSGIYGSGEVREVISHFIDFYQQNCKEGERLGEIINKIGWNSSIEKRKEFDDKK